MVLRSREELGLRSGGKDGRKEHIVKEKGRPRREPEEDCGEEEPARHPKERLASQATVLMAGAGTVAVGGEMARTAILDTGAQSVMLGKRLAEKLGLTGPGQHIRRGMLVMTAEGGEPKWLPCTKNLVEIVLMPGREEQTSIRLQCGISDSEGFDVLLGTDLIWGVGMTICTWKEKVKFRKQYWVRGSKTGELPVSFVKQEPKRAYTAEQTGTKGRGRAGLAGRAAAANAWQEPIKLVELFGGIGAGLAALLKAGVAVKEWIYVESNEKVRKMAEHHARKAATGVS
ncbi:unnamed protein product [Closterium sp. NIES-53]